MYANEAFAERCAMIPSAICQTCASCVQLRSLSLALQHALHFVGMFMSTTSGLERQHSVHCVSLIVVEAKVFAFA